MTPCNSSETMSRPRESGARALINPLRAMPAGLSRSHACQEPPPKRPCYATRRLVPLRACAAAITPK